MRWQMGRRSDNVEDRRGLGVPIGAARRGAAMTWAELHGVLRGRGLIRADDALQAEAAVGAVTGVSYDSRTVKRGNVFVALKGQHADGSAFARQAIVIL